MSANTPLSTELSAQPQVQGETGAVPSDFGTLLSGCGIFQGTRTKLNVTGKDRVRWLNGMVSNNIRDLAVGRGVYAFVLNPQGHIQGDLYAFQRGESLLLDIAQSQVEKLLPLLSRYIIMDDVKLTVAGDQLNTIHLAGPKSVEVLRAAGVDVPTLEPLEFAEVNSPTGIVTVMRSDSFAIDSFELWLGADCCSPIEADLQQAGAVPVSAKSIETLRIASGTPEYGKDIHDKVLPQETGQDRSLNFTKGCYIGQEIVERIRARGAVHRVFSGFFVEGELPPAGTKIQAAGKDVGEITSTAVLPVGGDQTAAALGYIRREFLTSDQPLEAAGVRLRVGALPFKEVFTH